MNHDNSSARNLLEALGVACDYQDKDFDANLIAAIDKLGEQFGPMGVALAAAVRTEPEALNRELGEMFTHQREQLWGWLRTERYRATEHLTNSNGETAWVVEDHEAAYRQAGVVYGRDGLDSEDAAHALAEHLNRKITLAKVAQALTDNSAPKTDSE